ncbi:hypothetical protein RclHR1_05680007 [Rhizophagus clarus]|uniref:Uncharacterized protein n=1 Tax=Rhizophagus clarus TaxID=94130 RepID=A0A2Z6S6U6_9GLOM|nr:hypothetical protein RclHR1_05680007 [Rhizophagus clarus]
MVKTNFSGLNPVVVRAITNLHYRYSNETKNVVLPYSYYMKMGNSDPTFYIYCTACDSLVFICENTKKCADKHLNECIAKIELSRIIHIRSILLEQKIKKGLSSDEIEKLYNVYCKYRKSYEGAYLELPEFIERMAYHILNSAKAIQQAWWSYTVYHGPQYPGYLANFGGFGLYPGVLYTGGYYTWGVHAMYNTQV